MTAPPYPATTRAKGWRLELDYEQIEQSETWPLAAEIPLAQHVLLMMWLVAWGKQVPCGSFPNDEEVIRAACRVSPAMWPKLRGVLMRGWWLADDGRLYHPTLTKRVLEMMGRRRSDADRQAAKRARNAASSPETYTEVTRDFGRTPDAVHPESSTDHRPPNTSSSSPSAQKKPRKRAAVAQLVGVEELVAAGVAEQHAIDWLHVRSKKALPLTKTAWEETVAEAEVAGMTPAAAVHRAAKEGWGGFKAKWLTDAPAVAGHVISTLKRDSGAAALIAQNDAAAEGARERLFGRRTGEVIDA